jgi:hypothetical protein
MPSPTVVSASDLLPAAERRRTGIAVKVALTIAHQACVHAGRDPASVATVFSSSSGDGETVHHIFETLASSEREVSPTRFHNSVHNAAAGYWSIATQSREPSTSLCCYDASFAAGLLDAATQVVVDGKSVALIAYDHPYPEPLHSKRPLSGTFGVALVLAPQPTHRAIARLDLSLSATPADATRMANEELEALRSGIPAARSLPLLAALACGQSAVVLFDCPAANHLRAVLTPIRNEGDAREP